MARPKGSGKTVTKAKTETTEKRKPGRPKGSGKKPVQEAPKVAPKEVQKEEPQVKVEKKKPGRPKKIQEAPKQAPKAEEPAKEKRTRAPKKEKVAKKEKAPKEEKAAEAPKQPEEVKEPMSDMHIMVPESKKRRFNAAVAARHGARKNSEILIEFIDKYIEEYEAELRKS